MTEELKKRFAEANKLREAGNLLGAKQILIEISEANPSSVAAFAVLGHICWELKLWDEAIQAFQHATKLKPALEAVSLGLFHCLWESGKRDEAGDEVRRFTKLTGSDTYSEIVREFNLKMEK